MMERVGIKWKYSGGLRTMRREQKNEYVYFRSNNVVLCFFY